MCHSLKQGTTEWNEPEDTYNSLKWPKSTHEKEKEKNQLVEVGYLMNSDITWRKK